MQIEFSADEEIAHVAIGNSIAWEVAPAGNILFLKAREVQPITNLQVVTTRRDGSKRSYQFELMVKDGEISTAQETYFLVKFRYPQDEAERRRLAALLRQEKNKLDKLMVFLIVMKPTDHAIGLIVHKGRAILNHPPFMTTEKPQLLPFPIIKKFLLFILLAVTEQNPSFPKPPKAIW